MVHRVTVHIGRRMGHPLRRRQLIRGIGLEEQTITGNGPQDRRMGGLSRVEGIARDAETAAEANPFAHQFGRPAVAVQQETPRKARSPPQAIQQGSPSLQAMQGDGEATRLCQVQLHLEHLQLDFQWSRSLRPGTHRQATLPGLIQDPTVQSHLTQSHSGGVIQTLDQNLAPGSRPRRHPPRVQPKGGNHRRALFGQPPDLRPIGFASSIDDHAGNPMRSRGGHHPDGIMTQPGILQVIMGIEPTHGFLWGMSLPHNPCRGNLLYADQLSFSQPMTTWWVPFSKLSRTTEAAVGYFELGMMEAALQELDQLPSQDQLEPEVLELRSVIHQQNGQWFEAARAFEALCARKDADVEDFIGWGCCLYELGTYEEARQALLSAPETIQGNGLWNFHLACYEALVGHPETARERVQRALRLDPCLRHMAEHNTYLAPLLRSVI